MIITEEWIVKNKTPAGGYNKKQFEILGIQYPPKKGWKDEIIGLELSEKKVKDFENVSKGLLEGQRTIFQFINKTETEKDIQKKKEIQLINIADISNYNIDYFVYTDGACLNNGADNAIAGIGIYFCENNPKNVSKKVVGKKTNNIAELQAIIDVFEIIKDDIDSKKICIVSDSKYALNCVTEYGEKQSLHNWQKDIPNKELVKCGYELYKNQRNIYFMYIKAHTENSDIHSKGNYGADKLANKAICLEECPYFSKELEKIYLDVPFSKKEEIKKLGGRWNSGQKKWYIFDNNENIMYILDNFKRFQIDI